MKVETPSIDARTAQADVHRDGHRSASPSRGSYEAPRFEVICLACEISAYAPDEGDPPF